MISSDQIGLAEGETGADVDEFADAVRERKTEEGDEVILEEGRLRMGAHVSCKAGVQGDVFEQEMGPHVDGKGAGRGADGSGEFRERRRGEFGLVQRRWVSASNQRWRERSQVADVRVVLRFLLGLGRG